MDSNTKILELINAKRQGLEHSAADIYWLINYLDKIPDYQLSAWLMAVCLNGLTKAETVELTRAMAFSGHVLTLQRHAECSLDGPIKRTMNRGFVDKHSTGGVGDKTSLVIGPLLAAVGFKVSKFSGRALGHTGGTVDKLEAIPGFRTDISMKQFETQIETIGIALGAQTDEFAPADKRLYSLRDKTGTVESIPLIASSVMSKKIAAGADHIILDVKVGKGAFMKDLRSARELARTMKDIGTALNLNVQVLLTNMDRPLGATVGNSLEVLEAISVLKGYKNFEAYLANRHPERSEGSLGGGMGILRSAQNDGVLRNDEESDFYKLCIDLCATICDRSELVAALESGAAYAKFLEFVRAQSDVDVQLDAMSAVARHSERSKESHGGSKGIATATASPRNDGAQDLLGQDLDRLIANYNKPSITYTAVAEASGYICEIDAKRIGELVHELGYSPVDNSAGLILHKTVGDKVREGEPLFTLSACDAHKLNSVKLAIHEAIKIAKNKGQQAKLVYQKI